MKNFKNYTSFNKYLNETVDKGQYFHLSMKGRTLMVIVPYNNILLCYKTRHPEYLGEDDINRIIDFIHNPEKYQTTNKLN